MNKYAFLKKGLDLCEEPWMAPHIEVMKCHDKADVLDQQSLWMVTLFQSLETIFEGLDDPSHSVTSSEAKGLCELCISWYDCSKKILGEVRALEEDAFNVPKASGLRECIGKASGWIDSVRKLSASLEDISEGRYLTLDQVLDVIRL